MTTDETASLLIAYISTEKESLREEMVTLENATDMGDWDCVTKMEEMGIKSYSIRIRLCSGKESFKISTTRGFVEVTASGKLVISRGRKNLCSIDVSLLSEDTMQDIVDRLWKI